MGYANARGLFPRLRSNRSNSRATTNVSANIRQRYAAGCQLTPIAAPREHGNATEFKTYGAISVMATLSTLRARTLALKVRNAAGAVISAKCLALWSNRRENARLVARLF
jgi:hypothetical protein